MKKWIECDKQKPIEPCLYTVEDFSPYTLKNNKGKPTYSVKYDVRYLEMYQRVVAWCPLPKPYIPKNDK